MDCFDFCKDNRTVVIVMDNNKGSYTFVSATEWYLVLPLFDR